MTFEEEQITLLNKQTELHKIKMIYIQRLSNIRDEINNIEKEITSNCLHFFKQHDFIEEREEGIYGETFYICSRCNYMR